MTDFVTLLYVLLGNIQNYVFNSLFVFCNSLFKYDNLTRKQTKNKKLMQW